VRAFNFKQKRDMEVYASSNVEIALKREFFYAFEEVKYPGVPKLNLNIFKNEPFEISGLEIVPIQGLHYKLPVFENVATYPCIIIFQKTKANTAKHKIKIATNIDSKNDLIDLNDKITEVNQSKYSQNNKKIFTLTSDKDSEEVVSKIKIGTKQLQEICNIKAGIHNGNIRNKLIVEKKVDSSCKRLLVGKNVGRYAFKWENLYVRYDSTLANKSKGEYCSLRDENIFTQKEKILVRDIGKRLPATYDDKQYYCMDTIYVVFLKDKYKEQLNLKYILGILNSNLLEFYFRKLFGTVHVGSNYQRYKKQFLIALPIKIVNLEKQEKV
jgi:hypothetical protein